jgi:hypothetical protein
VKLNKIHDKIRSNEQKYFFLFHINFSHENIIFDLTTAQLYVKHILYQQLNVKVNGTLSKLIQSLQKVSFLLPTITAYETFFS